MATTSDATPLVRLCIAAPPSVTRSTAIPVNSATESGPLTYANASAVITTTSTSPSSSAGPETHGPITVSTVGTTPDACANTRAMRPQPSSAATLSRSSAPEVSSTPTIGMCESSPIWTARATAAAPAEPSAPWCLPPATRNHATGRPSISRSPAVAAASTRAPIATAFVTMRG